MFNMKANTVILIVALISISGSILSNKLRKTQAKLNTFQAPACSNGYNIPNYRTFCDESKNVNGPMRCNDSSECKIENYCSQWGWCNKDPKKCLHQQRSKLEP